MSVFCIDDVEHFLELKTNLVGEDLNNLLNYVEKISSLYFVFDHIRFILEGEEILLVDYICNRLNEGEDVNNIISNTPEDFFKELFRFGWENRDIYDLRDGGVPWRIAEIAIIEGCEISLIEEVSYYEEFDLEDTWVFILHFKDEHNKEFIFNLENDDYVFSKAW